MTEDERAPKDQVIERSLREGVAGVYLTNLVWIPVSDAPPNITDCLLTNGKQYWKGSRQTSNLVSKGGMPVNGHDFHRPDLSWLPPTHYAIPRLPNAASA